MALDIVKQAINEQRNQGGLFTPPFQGRMIWEVCYVLLLFIIQSNLLNNIFGISIDIITPYLAIATILLTPVKALVLISITSFILETHSSAPVGFYLCNYWALASFIFLIKHNIPWHNTSSWISLFTFAQTWLFAWSFFIRFTEEQYLPTSSLFYLEEAFKIFAAIVFGVFLVQVINKYQSNTKYL